MKRTYFLRGTAIALVAIFSFGTAQAALINGVLTFGGEADPSSGPGVDDAVGLEFVSGFLVTNATGSFDANGVGFGDTGAIADFSFNPLMPTPFNALMTIGGFSFSLETVVIEDQQDMFLVLSGTGTLSGPGLLEDTAYAWSMSVDGSGSNFAFSGTLAAIPVPPALLLFMSGLAALGIRRRA